MTIMRSSACLTKRNIPSWISSGPRIKSRDFKHRSSSGSSLCNQNFTPDELGPAVVQQPFQDKPELIQSNDYQFMKGNSGSPLFIYVSQPVPALFAGGIVAERLSREPGDQQLSNRAHVVFLPAVFARVATRLSFQQKASCTCPEAGPPFDNPLVSCYLGAIATGASPDALLAHTKCIERFSPWEHTRLYALFEHQNRAAINRVAAAKISPSIQRAEFGEITFSAAALTKADDEALARFLKKTYAEDLDPLAVLDTLAKQRASTCPPPPPCKQPPDCETCAALDLNCEARRKKCQQEKFIDARICNEKQYQFRLDCFGERSPEILAFRDLIASFRHANISDQTWTNLRATAFGRELIHNEAKSPH